MCGDLPAQGYGWLTERSDTKALFADPGDPARA
jgi:hypothetical protein